MTLIISKLLQSTRKLRRHDACFAREHFTPKFCTRPPARHEEMVHDPREQDGIKTVKANSHGNYESCTPDTRRSLINALMSDRRTLRATFSAARVALSYRP